MSYVLLNVGAPPFDNRNARLAVAYAADRDEFIALRANDLPEKAERSVRAGERRLPGGLRLS